MSVSLDIYFQVSTCLVPTKNVNGMPDLSNILTFLEQERDRYVLEAAELERRLSFIHNQIITLESLISGYALEEQMYSSPKRFPDLPSSTAVLEDSTVSVSKEELDFSDSDLEDLLDSKDVEEDENLDAVLSNSLQSNPSEEKTTSTLSVDISDIPKLATGRKLGALPLLEEFREYSIQNAILILMRRRPDLHFHVDALVRDLYGDTLTPVQVKTAKANVAKMLTTGLQIGMWHQVLYGKNVYTLHYEKGVTSKSLKRR
jgi:hypothetical protein